MIFIDNTDELERLCQKMAKNSYVALDTEFIRERSFFAKLCLIQICGEGYEALIDPLAKGIDLEPFFELLQNQDVIKVFHSARQDVEIFYDLTGKVVNPLFDTQVASMVCGLGDMVSYQNFCQGLLGVKLDKGQRFTDWSVRPLSEKQMQYALADVTYLFQAYPKLKEKLQAEGRISWLDEEMDILTNPKTYQKNPEEAWLRIKGGAKNPKALSILKELAKWREKEAIRMDKPRKTVLKDEILQELVIYSPSSMQELAQMRGFPKSLLKSRFADDVLQAIKKGKENSSNVVITESKVQIPKNKKNLVCVLNMLLNIKSEQAGVAAHLIASATDVEMIAMYDKPDVLALRGWRFDIFGQDALLLKKGKIKIVFNPIQNDIEVERM